MKLKSLLPEKKKLCNYCKGLDNSYYASCSIECEDLNDTIDEIGEIEVELDWEKIGDILGEMMGYRCNCKPQQECKMCKRMGEIAKSIADNLHSLIRKKGEK